MIYTISFNPLALEEYQQAIHWYEGKLAGLGLRFEKVIEEKLNQILQNPLGFAKGKGYYRKATIQTFPFVIIYEFNARKREVYISAVYHPHRNPRNMYRKQ